jgi:hypothetical protein
MIKPSPDLLRGWRSSFPAQCQISFLRPAASVRRGRTPGGDPGFKLRGVVPAGQIIAAAQAQAGPPGQSRGRGAHWQPEAGHGHWNQFGPPGGQITINRPALARLKRAIPAIQGLQQEGPTKIEFDVIPAMRIRPVISIPPCAANWTLTINTLHRFRFDLSRASNHIHFLTQNIHVHTIGIIKT